MRLTRRFKQRNRRSFNVGFNKGTLGKRITLVLVLFGYDSNARCNIESTARVCADSSDFTFDYKVFRKPKLVIQNK